MRTGMRHQTLSARTAPWLLRCVPLFGVLFYALYFLGFVHRPWWWGLVLVLGAPALWVCVALWGWALWEIRAARWRTTLKVGDTAAILSSQAQWVKCKVVVKGPNDEIQIMLDSPHSKISQHCPRRNLYPLQN
jgi:hypothetical protein